MTTQLTQKKENTHIIEVDLASFVAGVMVSFNPPHRVKVGVNQNTGYVRVSLTYGQESSEGIIHGMDRNKPLPESVFSCLEEEISKTELIMGSYRQTSKSRDNKGMVYATWEKNDSYQ